ncbi:MAG: hypothetical protein QM749_15870 [Aquabacterium sp.]
MRLYLIQSRETGQFLVPHCGYVGWTQSLRHALDCGLVDHETASELVVEHADDAELVFVMSDERH